MKNYLHSLRMSSGGWFAPWRNRFILTLTDRNFIAPIYIKTKSFRFLKTGSTRTKHFGSFFTFKHKLHLIEMKISLTKHQWKIINLRQRSSEKNCNNNKNNNLSLTQTLTIITRKAIYITIYKSQNPKANDCGHPNTVLVELKRGTSLKRPRK